MTNKNKHPTSLWLPVMMVLSLLSGSTFQSFAQSNRVRYYESSASAALAADLNSALDGDVFVLTSSGGRYALDSWLNISAKVSIFADKDLAKRPVISNKMESNTVQIMRLFADGCALFVRGIEFDSESRGPGNYPVKYAIRTNPDIGSYSLALEDCYFHGDFMANDGSHGSILRLYNGTFADSIIIRDCIFEGDEGIVINSPEGDFSWGKFEISNCTFMNILNDQAIQIVQKGDYKTLPFLIDHCTFVNVGGMDEQVIRIDSLYSARVTNSILASTDAGISFSACGDTADQALADYINVFECPLPLTDQGGVLGDNTWNLDPMFAAADRGDLRLGNPDLLSLGSDGLPLGDLRWADIFGPAAEGELEGLTFTTLLLRFNEWVDTTSAEVAANYVLSGSAGFTGTVKKAELYNFHTVVLTLENFDSLVGLEIVVSVTGVEDLEGNRVDPAHNSASYIVKELRPVVSAEKQTLTNGIGQKAYASSNLDTGYIWLILDGESASSLTALEAAVASGKGARAKVSAANTDTEISVFEVEPGTHYAYASDAGGQVSEKSDNPIRITDGIPPRIRLSIQSIYNNEGDVAIAQSNEPGKLYIVKDGHEQDEEENFIAAILVSMGASAIVSEVNTDVEIPSEGCLPGIYFAYAVDLAGNVSAKGDMPINILESAVVVERKDAVLARVYASGEKILIKFLSESPARAVICDLSGNTIVNQLLTSECNTFTMEKDGLYFVKLIAPDGQVQTFKLMVLG